MHLIFGMGMGFLAMVEFGLGGLVLGGLAGILTAEILALRRRLAIVEDKASVQERQVKRAEEEVVFAPAEPPAATPELPAGGQRPPAQPAAARVRPKVEPRVKSPPERKPSGLDRIFASLGQGAADSIENIKKFFTSGNVVLKIGIIIIFFGMAFLLKYAAQRNLVPLELRLAGVALSGVVMLGIGWRLRQIRSGYGLVLQGGGVGVLYLVIFGAAKLYGFLPMLLALGIMVGLVALSCLLAVLQNARSLAVFGITGGFLAPVLMSTGGGSHVLLFSYYGLLNAGIFGIAWAKSWRELNLLGFFFTFAIGTLWGSSGYRPAHFASTEPFLLLFFVFYASISILFAHRQPINLRGYVDGPLVFGLPLVVSGLQYFLVRDMEYGMALSALGFGIFYLVLAMVLWRRLSDSMHLLCEAFLALGVVFGSLAIPLALDGHWSASIWALEGAGMVWVGAKQRRLLARHFGLLLQFAAAIIFLDAVWYPLAGLPFANHHFLGCLFLSAAALVSSYCLDRYVDRLRNWEKYYSLPLMIWGLAWWYLGGLREVDRQLPVYRKAHAFLFFCSATSVGIGLLARNLPWKRLSLALLLQLAAMVVLVPVSLLGFHSHVPHLFNGWGAVAWPIAFAVQYRLLYAFGTDWPRVTEISWHLGTLWLLVFTAGLEIAWGVGQVPGLSSVWSFVCWGLVPAAGLFLLARLAGGVHWPMDRLHSSYLGLGGMIPAAGLCLWLLLSFAKAGDPAPLTYLPLINPLELTGLLAIFSLVFWALYCRRSGLHNQYFKEKYLLASTGVLLFFLLNSIVARSVHFFAAVPYYPDSLFHSAIFQASLAALWGFGALTITIWATRRGNRPVWMIGAVLLAMVVVKLFLVDLSGTGTIARIVSFLVVGGLMLVIGYFPRYHLKLEGGGDA